MNRRQFLTAIIAAPLVGLAAKLMPPKATAGKMLWQPVEYKTVIRFPKLPAGADSWEIYTGGSGSPFGSSGPWHRIYPSNPGGPEPDGPIITGRINGNQR